MTNNYMSIITLIWTCLNISFQLHQNAWISGVWTRITYATTYINSIILNTIFEKYFYKKVKSLLPSSQGRHAWIPTKVVLVWNGLFYFSLIAISYFCAIIRTDWKEIYCKSIHTLDSPGLHKIFVPMGNRHI